MIWWGVTKNDLEEVKKDLIEGKRIARNDHIYQVKDGQLQVLDENVQLKQNKQLDIEYRAKTFAQKSGSWHVTNEYWQQARKLVDLAYQYAEPEGRQALNTTLIENGLVTIGDWDLVTLVKQGSASAISDNYWWSLDLMA